MTSDRASLRGALRAQRRAIPAPQRIAAAEAKIRAGLPPPAMPKGATPEAVQQQIEAALATAKTAWKAEEAARFTQAEEKWRTDSGAALGRLT